MWIAGVDMRRIGLIVKLMVKNINNHTRGAQLFSSFTFRHENGTVYELDVKPHAGGYALNRYRATVFKATDKVTGQDVKLTVKKSAWR